MVGEVGLMIDGRFEITSNGGGGVQLSPRCMSCFVDFGFEICVYVVTREA